MADLTYFIGRPFQSLEETDDGWAIVLDGNARITNKDPEIEIPDVDELNGTQFVRPVFNEDDTVLQFGVRENVACEVTLNPAKYTISDPTIASDSEIYPQVPVELSDEIPPDPSDERVAEGPEEPQEDEEAV